jgi:hypothetical protein
LASLSIDEVEGLAEELQHLREEVASLRDDDGFLYGAKAIGAFLGCSPEHVHNERQAGRLDGVVGQWRENGKLVAEKRKLAEWRRDHTDWTPLRTPRRSAAWDAPRG